MAWARSAIAVLSPPFIVNAPMSSRKSSQIHFRITEAEHNLWRRIAARLRMSLTELVVSSVRQYVRRVILFGRKTKDG